ncbi:MAG: GTPase Era [Burkholderiales bacterium]|jgi:GTP-binding protein Era|nr:GTPase Era [Burkholderiales bacterium]MCA3160642.1 GTPase Era [Burkholderiales bacterium]MCA3163226.1 GTPase Era [Burkholderiales bacterium]MCA3166018.1 GTPase Era [Burkholderiales bacterium]MCA3171078.1 GTPase Era [Burkholderiales bacterium]
MSKPDFRTGLVAIVGRPNVGKSTLLNALVGQKLSITADKPQTTRHRINGVLTTEQAQYIFVDTPGYQTRHKNALNRTLNRTVRGVLNDVDVVLLVIEPLRFGAEDQQVLELIPESVPLILVLNKLDTVKGRDKLLPFVAQLAQQRSFAAVVPVSASKGKHLQELLAEIKQHLPVAEPMFDPEDLTDRPVRFLAAELIREKVFRLVGDELPYTSTVIIDKFEESETLQRIFATVLVENDNQKAILIGAQGERMKRIASEARADLEKLLGSKVYLEVWVKVKSGWADTEASVRAYGYE